MSTPRKQKRRSASAKPTNGTHTRASAKSKPAPRKSSTSTTERPDRKSSTKAAHGASKARAKAKPTAPRTEAQYQSKPERFKDSWDRVLSVISKMRSDKVSLTQASRDAGVSPRTVTKWGKSALRKQKSGKYAAKASDNLLRLVTIPSPQGIREIAVRGSKQVSLLAEYWNALHRYLQTGDARQLRTFQGKHITDANGTEIPFPVDLAELNRLGSAGVLSFESLYARAA